jgi:Ca2+-binding RTX toxin-like protein
MLGGFGRDMIDGNQGADRISGGGARDILRGDLGADVLVSRDGRTDKLRGFPGLDRAHVDALDITLEIGAFF